MYMNINIILISISIYIYIYIYSGDPMRVLLKQRFMAKMGWVGGVV
jgi:hypothetical protein